MNISGRLRAKAGEVSQHQTGGQWDEDKDGLSSLPDLDMDEEVETGEQEQAGVGASQQSWHYWSSPKHAEPAVSVRDFQDLHQQVQTMAAHLCGATVPQKAARACSGVCVCVRIRILARVHTARCGPSLYCGCVLELVGPH